MRSHTVYLIACLILSHLPAQAQYKAILSPPTAPGLATSQDDGVAALTSAGGAFGFGQYNKQAAKMLLTDGSITPVDPGASPLGHPYIYSEMMGTDGSQSVGWGLDWDGSHYFHTCIHWDSNGTPTTLVSPQWRTSHCNATSGGLHAGYVENYGSAFQSPPTVRRAALWTSPTTFIDLHTGGNNFSEVLGISGNQQVGYQATSQVDVIHSLYSVGVAYLWNGASSGAVNLNPAGFTASAAFATNGSQQGGWAYNATLVSPKHAMLWTGTAASAVDLNPAGWYDTQVRGIYGSTQVGDGYSSPPNGMSPSTTFHGNQHALVWHGTADSMVDLNQFLPLGFTNAIATGVDASGNVVGYTWGQVGRNYVYMDVVFTPQAASASQLQSVTITPGTIPVPPWGVAINQGDILQGQITLAGPAPAGGQVIALTACSQDGFSMLDLAPAPATVIVPEGQTTASFSVATNNRWGTGGGMYFVRIYGNDGTVSRFGGANIILVPYLTALTVPSPIVGGLSTTGSVTANGPPFFGGGDIVSLTSGDPSRLTVPATVTISQGSPVWPFTVSFPVTTTPVQTPTTVPVTATLGNSTLTVLVTVTPAPPVSLTGITLTQEVNVGSPYSGTLTFSGPVPFGGAIVTLVSDNPAVAPAPATVTAAQGQSSVSFSGVSGTVSSSTTAHITATYNGVSLTAPITVDPKPPVTITVAEYDTISKVLKVSATTTISNSTLSFGTDPNLGPIGPMTLSGGVWSASVKNMATAPALVTVWNSTGGSVTTAPTLRAK